MDIKSAVDQTIAYSAFFSFPLLPQEIHFWLISNQRTSFDTIKKHLPPVNPKTKKLRQSLAKNTLHKEKIALQLASLVRYLPGIELLALTGSVAIGNAKKNDDIDLLVVTKPHLLWLTRPVFLFLLNLFFRRRRHPQTDPHQVRNLFCPNLWLDTTALKVPKYKQNLYTAHEVLQIKPLFDRGHVYQNFLLANRWSAKYLANAYSFLKTPSPESHSKSSIFTYIVAPLNLFLFLAQYSYMFRHKTTEHVTLHSAYFHKKDLSPKLIQHLRQSCL